MKKEEFFKSTTFKIMLPIIALVIVVALWRNGFEFGQWLNKIIN